MDDPSGKVKGVIGGCAECRKTTRNTIATFLSVLAILCGAAFAYYALRVEDLGIDPGDHWIGSTSLTVAEWAGKSHRNVEGLAVLLGLLFYGSLRLQKALAEKRNRENKSSGVS